MSYLMSKYMNPVSYESVHARVKHVYDMVEAFCVSKSLSGDGNGNDIVRKLVNQPVSDNTIAVHGTNYKFNCYEDKIELIIYEKKIAGYANITRYNEKLQELELDFKLNHRSLGGGSFEVKIFINFGKEIDQGKAMQIFQFFNIN
ncbi:hypothetical protein D3C71_1109870 [compost metagenome]